MNEKEQYWKNKWREAAEKSTFSMIYPKAEVLWNHSAATYDLGMGNSFDRVDIVVKELEVFQHRNGKINTIFDIGSGTGSYTLPLSGLADQVTALDCSLEMNRCLLMKAQEQHINNIEIITDDFQTHTFHDIYDVVLGSMNPGLYHPDAFEKMLRLCGKLLIYVGIIPQNLEKPSSLSLEERLFKIRVTHGNSNDIRYPFEVLKAKGYHPVIREVACNWEFTENSEEAKKKLKLMYQMHPLYDPTCEQTIIDFVEEHSYQGQLLPKGGCKLGILFCYMNVK